MVRTPVWELLCIEQPIVQAPMAAVPELAAAVSNSGAPRRALHNQAAHTWEAARQPPAGSLAELIAGL